MHKKFYRTPTTEYRLKSGSPWRKVWSVQATSHPVCMVKFPNRDSLLFCTEQGEIFEIDVSDDEDDTPRLRAVSCQGSKYEILVDVNPKCKHIVAIDAYDQLSVFYCHTGKAVGTMSLQTYGRGESKFYSFFISEWISSRNIRKNL